MKKIVSIFFFISALLLAFPVNAQVSIILESKDITAYTGETTTIDVIIQNSQAVSDEFTINIWPTYWGGISVVPEKPRIKIAANSSETVKLYFAIPIDSEEVMPQYNITVKSIKNENISTVQLLNLIVKRTVPIRISDVKAEKYILDPEETVKIEISIMNSANEAYLEASLETYIKKDGTTIERFDDSIPVIQGRSTQKIDHLFSFDKYAEPDIYTIEVFLKDNLNRIVSSRTATSPIQAPTLKLNAVYNITHKKSVSYGLLLQTITIIVKNEGNSPTTSFYVTEDMPKFMKGFFYPMEQTTAEVIQDRIYHHWLIESLMPGEERIIRYQINLWNVWILTVILIIIVVIAFRLVYGPEIIKRFRHFGPLTRGKEVLISLEVKNRSMHEIKDVVVKDFVPPIVGVVSKFDTLKPMVKRTRAGTEVIWKFKSLKPREERVLTYRIKPVVDIAGILKLPRAYIRFTDRKKRRKASASKSIIIKSK